MKSHVIVLAVVLSLGVMSTPTFAQYPSSLWGGRHVAAENHARHHDDLDHRDYHRELDHRQAHRYPMTVREHGALHDDLNHEAYHDDLEHRQSHRNRVYSRNYSGFRYGYGASRLSNGYPSVDYRGTGFGFYRSHPGFTLYFGR